MAEKRKDSKGRNLWDGEYQRADGRYEYRYKDKRGERHSVYSWKLTKNDKAPAGKRCKESLREMEECIQKEMDSGIDTWRADKITLDMYFERYIEAHTKLKPSTRESYCALYHSYLAPYIGSIPIAKITTAAFTDAYAQCVKKHGLGAGSMRAIHAVASGLMTSAKQDALISTNPAKEALHIVKGRIDMREPVTKTALTRQEEEAFLEFVKNNSWHKKHYALFVFLFGTGCRISEAAGMTWDDIDFDNGRITVRRQLQLSSCNSAAYPSGTSRQEHYRIVTPKTKSGIRVIPLYPAVREVLLELKAAQKAMQDISGKKPYEVDGVTGFVFTTRNNTPVNATGVGDWISRAEKGYAKAHGGKGRNSKEDFIELPHLTPHIFRHTYCTRLCESGMNMQVVQKFMGHADVSLTAKVYTHVYDMELANDFATAQSLPSPV
jgi:integrase